jgi:predicted Zn-dependent protease
MTRRDALVVLLPAAIGCAPVLPPDFGRLPVSDAQRAAEVRLAREFDVDLKLIRRPVDDPALAGYVTDLGREIAAAGDRPEIPYEFRVVSGAEPAAFTPGDGRVYVSLGTLRTLDNRDELAAVLAHQIAHVARTHPLLVEARAVHQTPDRGYPAAMEEQADRVAVEYLKRTGYNSAAVGELLMRLQSPVGTGQTRRATCLACDAVNAGARLDALRRSLDAAVIDLTPRPARKSDDPPYASVKKRAAELLAQPAPGGFSPRP